MGAKSKLIRRFHAELAAGEKWLIPSGKFRSVDSQLCEIFPVSKFWEFLHNSSNARNVNKWLPSVWPGKEHRGLVMGIINSLTNGHFALQLKKINEEYWKLKNWREEESKVYLEKILERLPSQFKEDSEDEVSQYYESKRTKKAGKNKKNASRDLGRLVRKQKKIDA